MTPLAGGRSLPAPRLHSTEETNHQVLMSPRRVSTVVTRKSSMLSSYARDFFKTPRYPNIPGLDSFPGIVKHSFHYKSGVPFEGKKVMVVGNSYSAGDIAVDISLYTDKAVEISVGKGTWILPRVVPGGWLSDRSISRRQLYWANEGTMNNMMIDSHRRDLLS